MILKLQEIFKNVFDFDITEKTKRENIVKWDSLGHLDILMAIEHGFNIKFTFDEMVRIKSIKDIIQHLKKKGIKK